MSFDLRVFFEDPFWVGLFSITDGETTKYCRVVFGKEPTDIEIYRFWLKNWVGLQFTESGGKIAEKPVTGNPKRRQREVSKRLQERSGTRASYEIIKQSMIQSKKKVRKESQSRREAEQEEYKYQLKQAKAKAKHRGH